MVIKTLHIIAALGTVLTGLFAMFRPRSITGFTGVEARSSRGITEIRAVFGGFFLALGIAPLILQSATAYLMLGIAYLVVAGVRTISMFVDKSLDQSNIISVAIEILFGVILVI